MSSLKTFFIHYSQVFIGNGISILFGLISFPILTRMFTKEEYGIVGLISTTLYFLLAFGKAGLSNGVIRYYAEYSENSEKLTIFSSTLALRGVILSTVTVLFYILIIPVFSHFLNFNPKYNGCFYVMSISLFLIPLKFIVSNLLRVNGKIFFNVIMGVVGNFLGLGISVWFFKGLIGQLFGYFIGLSLAEIIVSFIFFTWFFRNCPINAKKVSRDLSLKLIKFGFPLLISELTYLLLTYVDRYMIVHFKSADDLGVYTVGYNLASYISNLIMLSLSIAVIPIYVNVFEKEGKEKTEEFLEKCLKYLLIAIFPVFFGYLGISKDLCTLVASEKYAAASSFSPIILLGLIFLGLNNILNAGLYLSRKTSYIPFILLAGLLVNIILNLTLITKYGLVGAAMSTVAASITTTVLTIYFSFKFIVVRVSLKSVIYYLSLAILMYLIIFQVNLSRLWMTVFIKILVGCFIVTIGSLYREREIRLKLQVMLTPKIFKPT